MDAHSMERTGESRRKAAWIFLAVGVVFLAANLRAPITAVGPLVPSIQQSLHLSNTAAGILTTIPLLAFAVLSPFASRLARRFGMEAVLLYSLLFLLIGHIMRPLDSAFFLFAGTIFIGTAIAVDNVLMPALIKEKFANQLGAMMGTYTVAMNLSAALASGFSIPLAETWGLGWRGSLRFWAVLTIAAFLLWAPQVRYRKKVPLLPAAHAGRAPLWKSLLAWQVTIFMGVQSFLFYSLITWLPVLLQSKGMNEEMAGWMLFLFQFAQLPFMFIVPVMAEKMENQKLLVFLTFLLMAAGIVGYLFQSASFMWLSAVLLGIGAGFAFSLAMMFFTLRTRHAMQAADLSAMAQSFGYLLAAFGPPAFGWLYDITKGWTAPLGLLLFASGCLLFSGLGAARNKYIS